MPGADRVAEREPTILSVMRPTTNGARRIALPMAALIMASACAANLDASATPDAASAAPGTPSQLPTGPRPIIVDTDVDVSDVAALIVLLRDPSVDVRAVTITPVGTGVTDCGSGRTVIRYVLEEMGASDIPFACGERDAGPDAHPFPPEWRSAADTGWGFDIPTRPQSDLPESAVDLLSRTIEESPSPPLLVPLGPWTNLEHALAADPTIATRVAGIFAMASAIDVDGNVVVEGVAASDRLEWNAGADPSAFVTVFDSGIPITLVPLDATNDVPMDPNLIDRLAANHAAAGADFVYELFIRVPERVGDGQQLWDELAALALGDPDLVTWEDATLSVDASGRLDRDPGGRSVRFATGADRPAVEAALLAALGRGGARTTPFEVSGELHVTWDGTTCAAEPAAPLSTGVVLVTFDNTSGGPATAAVVFVTPPHSWLEVIDVLASYDFESEEQPPEWIAARTFLGDETGSSGPRSGSMVAEAGTHGPVCFMGEPPDLAIATGDPFEVGATP